jgi:hypothetical protein
MTSTKASATCAMTSALLSLAPDERPATPAVSFKTSLTSTRVAAQAGAIPKRQPVTMLTASATSRTGAST